MTSIVNGTSIRNGASGVPVSSGSDNSSNFGGNPLGSSGTPFTNLSLDNDMLEILTSTTWSELDTSWSEARPDSRQSSVTTPVSTPTPRPPSATSYSPMGPAVPQSPLNHYPQPSPSASSHQLSGGHPFAYSPLTEQSVFMDTTPPPETKPDTKVNVLDEAPTDSARLRDLLTKPPASADNGDSDNINHDTILKKLLNQPDEDDVRGDHRTSPRVPHSPALHGRNAMPGTSELPKSTSSGGRMLLQVNEFDLFMN